jgi:predicted ArsR family transcriptional regulator
MTDGRQAVVETLRSSPSPMSIVEIARRLRVHPNTVRFHLQTLTSDGRVERVESTRTTPGRPPLMFRAHHGMDPTGPRNYQGLSEALAASMSVEADPVGRAVDAGRTWGNRLAEAAPYESVRDDDQAIHRLVRVLDELGFSPDRRTAAAGHRIRLGHCPFLDLIPQHQQVICPLHLGLMQGFMSTIGAETTITHLEPLVGHEHCLAHVGPADATS